MKTTLKKIANLFLIFVMVIAVSSALAQPLPITGDGDLLSASGRTETVDQPLPITGDGDLLFDVSTFLLLFI
jgi:hypothetical protein